MATTARGGLARAVRPRHRRRADDPRGRRIAGEAVDGIKQAPIAEHERDDESQVYPRLAKVLHESYGLAAMSSCASRNTPLGAPSYEIIGRT